MVKYKAHGQPGGAVAPESAGPMTAKGQMRPAFRAEPTGSTTAKTLMGGPMNIYRPLYIYIYIKGGADRVDDDRERADGGRGPRKERQGRPSGRMERRPGPRTAPEAAAPPAAPSQNDSNDNDINLYYYQNINYDEKFIITAAPSQNDENNNGIHLSSLYRQPLRPQDRSILLPGI